MIVAVVGPSGAGKDTLIAGALSARPDILLVRRVITRPTTAGGEDFEGVTSEDFAIRKADGEFALDWEAHGLCYGIPKDQTTAPLVMFNGSRQALGLAQSVFPDLRVIVVTAPDHILADRLAARGRETRADIENRLKRATFELPDGIDATVVINDGTEAEGVTRFLGALADFR